MERTRGLKNMDKPNRIQNLYKQGRYEDIFKEYYPSIEKKMDKYDDEDLKSDVILFAWEFIITKGEKYAYGYEFPMYMNTYITKKIETILRHNSINTISLNTQEGRHEIYNASLLEEYPFSDFEIKEAFKSAYKTTDKRMKFQPRDYVIISELLNAESRAEAIEKLAKMYKCSNEAIRLRVVKIINMFHFAIYSWDICDLFD